MNGFSFTKMLFGGLTGLMMTFSGCLGLTGCVRRENMNVKVENIGEYREFIETWQRVAADNNMAITVVVRYNGKTSMTLGYVGEIDTGVSAEIHLQGQSDHPQGGPDAE